MVNVAITGHVQLTDEAAAWIFEALLQRLRELAGTGFHGITCLARGTDQIFARAVLALSGTFEVILPAEDYRATMAATAGSGEFSELIDAADTVDTMPFELSSRRAYLAASEDMLRRCDLLLAAWDGQPSRSTGDTADVIAAAHRLNRPVEVFWPD